MLSEPLVSVICVCHNHERFIEESIHSVAQQTYKNTEIIIIDDASTDASENKIKDLLRKLPGIRYIPVTNNIGNCRAFNIAWKQSGGEYIIDLATDDVLYPDRIQHGVDAFRNMDKSYGVNFTNAEIIDETGNFLTHHFKVDSLGKVVTNVPEGNIFMEVIQKYFICPPTMMYKREVLEHLGGYDENLTYEDFDFWVRSSRNYKYVFSDEILVKKRVVAGSMGDRQFRIGSPDLRSTYEVCKKAMVLVRTNEERAVLKKRIHYEIRVAIRYLNFPLVRDLIKLLISLKSK